MKLSAPIKNLYAAASAWFLALPGHWVMAWFLALLSCLSLLAKWVVLPLNGALLPRMLLWHVWFVPVPFVLVFLATLLLAVLFSRRQPLLSLVLVWAHLFAILAIPANIFLRHPGVMSAYVEQAKTRLALVEFTNDYFPMNVNLQPLFEPVISIDGAWDPLLIAVSVLDTSWFIALLSACCLLILVGNGMSKGGRYAAMSGLGLGCVIALANFGALNDSLSASGNIAKIAQQSPDQAVALCGQTLSLNPALAYSETMMPACLMATLKVHGDRHPLASYSGLVWKRSGGQGDSEEFPAEPAFLFIYQRLLANSAQLQASLASTLDKALFGWLKRTGEAMVILNAQKAIADNKLSYAAHQLNSYIADDNLLKNYYLAYINTQIENPKGAGVNYKSLFANIQFAPIKADMLCGLGDTYSLGGDYVGARKLYIACKELDNASNYRVYKALSGT
jgi:hypothetical protein